jgi:beta-N-acetylhexosaminidase
MNLNFGIVADVSANPASFIYQRVFGGDPVAAGEHVAAAVTGANGLTLSTLKHFPGHGETESDSHTSVPTTDVSYEKWQQQDEPPFVSGINAGAEVVMFGHLIYSSVDAMPASLSAKWHQILSEQIGFTGISITDDMIMLQQSGDSKYYDPITNAISALQAGNTMLLFVLDHGGGESDIDPNSLIDGIVAAVENGSLDRTIINSNVRQVLTLRHNL